MRSNADHDGPFLASVSGVPRTGLEKMLINSTHPRRAAQWAGALRISCRVLSSYAWTRASRPAQAFRYRIQTRRALDIAYDAIHDQSVLHDVFDRRKALTTIVCTTFDREQQWLTSVLHVIDRGKAWLTTLQTPPSDSSFSSSSSRSWDTRQEALARLRPQLGPQAERPSRYHPLRVVKYLHARAQSNRMNQMRQPLSTSRSTWTPWMPAGSARQRVRPRRGR
jgi:hypothetical protein